jgi:hypothetical protein
VAGMMDAAALSAGRANVAGQAAAAKPQGFFPQPQAAAPQAAPAPAAPQPEPEQLQRDMTVTGAAANARQATRRMNGKLTESEPASEDEQKEYERATTALSRVLYEDDNTSQALLDALHPEDKVGSVAQTALLLFKQLDEKVDFDEAVIPQVTMDIVDRLVDLGEQGKGLTFTDEEVQGALGATWEGVMQMFETGTSPEDLEEATQGMTDDEINEQVATYKGYLGGDF